jgi:hypothetical protein
MNAPREGKLHKTSVLRVIAVASSVLFLAMAVKMGADSLHARSAGSMMSNWKGGTMAYQDGFKLTGVFAAFAVAFCYFAVRPRRNGCSQGNQAWNRG